VSGSHEIDTERGIGTSPVIESEVVKERQRSTGSDKAPPEKLREVGGPKGLEPTRFGDWERAGRCIDF
jgi:hypothetical protein